MTTDITVLSYYGVRGAFAFANFPNLYVSFRSFIRSRCIKCFPCSFKGTSLFLGSEAVLGPQTNGHPPPIEQRVGRQKLRPGSGFLSVRVTTDGPTRVLQVLDIKERASIFNSAKDYYYYI